MAKRIFSNLSRGTGVGGAISGFGGAISGFGADLISKAETDRENDALARADAEEIRQASLLQADLDPERPEEWEQIYEESDQKRWLAIFDAAGNVSGDTARKISNHRLVQREEDLAGLRTQAEKQERINRNINYEAHFAEYLESVNYGGNEENLANRISSGIFAVNSAHQSGDVPRVRDPKQAELETEEIARSMFSDFILQSGNEELVNNPNALVDQYDLGLKLEDKPLYGPDDIAELQRDFRAAKNNAESEAKKEFDQKGREVQRELWALQKEGNLTIEKMNSPEVTTYLTVPEQRTFWNSMNNTKTYTPEEKSQAHTAGIETMVAWRAGEMPLKDAKEKIDGLRSEGKVDDVDGQAWTEELLGFKKSTTAASGNATAMSLGVKSINQIKAIETKALQDAGGDVVAEIAKRNAFRNQQIIDLEAWEKAESRTPTEINKHVESMLAPAKEDLAKDIVTRRWYEGFWSGRFGTGAAPLFGGPGRGRLAPAESPEDIPRIKTDAEWEKLPSGTKFIDPNGRVRVK